MCVHSHQAKKLVVFSIDDSALCVFLIFLGTNFSIVPNVRLNENIHKKYVVDVLMLA